MIKKASVKLLTFLLAALMIFGMLPLSVFAEGETDTTTETVTENTYGSVTNYADFLANLKVLEGYADDYHTKTPGSADPGELVLNFIRTGVERYQDDNWETLAGQEYVAFTSYVKNQDESNGTTAMSLRNIVTKDFVLPNGNYADFGHMFGCMNISYINKGSADLSGWAGDLCDLLDYSVRFIDDIYANTDKTVEQMAAYIGKNCFGVDASDAFGWDDFYGDMDGYYLVSEYMKGEGSFSELMEAYYTKTLSDKDRAVYFVNNRFGVEDTKEAVRKAVYDAYSSDVGIKVLEAGRGLVSYTNERQACCYAFADYLYKVAGGQDLFIPGNNDDEVVTNGYYSVFSNEHSILAPGIEQDINYAQTVDGKQIVYYVATVNINRSDVTIKANYADYSKYSDLDDDAPNPNHIWDLWSVRDQTNTLVTNYRNKVDENGNKVYENFNAIVATNGDGYNITTGQPGGLLIMDGREWYGVDKDGFFAIIDTGEIDKDGNPIEKAIIGTQADYYTYKGQIKEAIGGFGAVLIKDGKINVTKNAGYTSSRASRTAIGIKADGSVVMMVLDGRQLPRSAGGAMEEIAQIMLEAGCVHAINLDGGGSTTYMSKPAGSDEIDVVNVPSDGYERNVAVSLVAISTAAPSTAFDHAIISSDYEYITAGTSMQFKVTGVSNTGNAADIPEGSYWRVSNESLAMIDENGVFTAMWSEETPVVGDVTVEFIVNGEVAGSKVIHIVIPDDIKFVEERIVAIYGEPKDIEVTVWYQGYPVAFTPLLDMGIFFPGAVDDEGNMELLFESDAGVIDGVTFTGTDDKGIRTAMILTALQAAGEVVAVKYATINLYYKDEANFDFENATMGNRKLAWNREIENAKSTDNKLYRISDPDSPVEIKYTFALDMTAIDFPAQLESIKSMLPTYQENATAWTYMLQLAERVCVQTRVMIRAEFSKDLEVDISELSIINDYFTLTSANIDENNVLTVVCNWVNQSQPIDPATANPLCILNGIKATVKDTAEYFNNEILIANNGNVTYDVYLAASSLHSFADNPSNQAEYGLYPYIHEDDCRGDFSSDFGDDETLVNNDKGARFSSQYIDFADIYTINNEIRQGWHQEGTDYYYYVDNEAVTGKQLVVDRKDSTQRRFYEFDETGKLVSEQGITDLVEFEGNLYYAVLGVVQTGWQQIDGNNYYFHLDTGKAFNGVKTIKERIFPTSTDPNTADYTYTFEDYILVRGDHRYDNIYGYTGWRYRWAGDWMKGCWFNIGDDTYHVEKNYPYTLTTGYGYYVHDFVTGESTGCFLFDEKGRFLKEFTGIAYVNWTSGSTQKSDYLAFKSGTLYTREFFGTEWSKGLFEGSDGYYYFVNDDGSAPFINTTRYLSGNGFDWTNEIVAGGPYTFDAYGRLSTPLFDEEIIENKTNTELTTEIIGRVMTIKTNTDAKACRIAYKYAEDKYAMVDAMINPYASVAAVADGEASAIEYNFAIPKDATGIKVMLSGDVNGDGSVTKEDVNKIYLGIMGKPNGIEDPNSWESIAADVNGDGKLTTADVAKLNAAINSKVNLDW